MHAISTFFDIIVIMIANDNNDDSFYHNFFHNDFFHDFQYDKNAFISHDRDIESFFDEFYFEKFEKFEWFEFNQYANVSIIVDNQIIKNKSLSWYEKKRNYAKFYN